MPVISSDVRQYMSQLGAKGGSQTTPKKIAASRRNGRKGGRPKKVKDESNPKAP